MSQYYLYSSIELITIQVHREVYICALDAEHNEVFHVSLAKSCAW